MRGGSGPGTAVAEPPVGARWFVPTSGAMFEAGRSWFKTPVVACYLNPEWRNVRMASLLVVRGLGGMVYGHAYLVDLLGAGLRDCYPIGAMSLRTFEKTVLKTFTDRLGGVDTCTLLDAANLVWGGLAVARDRGFSVPPCADGCARAAGERPSDERLDLSIFE
ncbi:MAG TPA: hypothetical protein VI643_01810, partial [Planctomycetota bacterium]|nr:hypothetical protein [Planctomycetota bacterium]